LTLDRLVSSVEGRIIADRAQKFEVVRRERVELRKRIPEEAWQQPLDVLDLPGRIHNLLLDTNVNTVGDLIYILEMGDDYFLKLRGLGEKALETVKETLTAYQSAQIDALVAAESEAVAEAEVAGLIDDGEFTVVEEVPLIDRVVDAEEMETSVPDMDFADEEVEIMAADEETEEGEIVGLLEPDEVLPEIEETLTPLDDLSQTIFVEEAKPAKPEPKKKPGVVVVRPTAEEAAAEEETKRKKRKGQPLVYNEDLDQVVVQRKRKKGGSDWLDEDIDLSDL
ncbi:MAG TPA: DNA-directed RNA polymerase subunit alpha C-terminal domain-containing protein, partial [Promineifilum sp.]|nr:DNA-directed RNA polymerase subunit alpha C-terminal domain-containing protein [Promineifilum sp.]